MSNIPVLEWIDKVDNPDLKAFLEQFGKEHYISADEVNAIRDRINSLITRENTASDPDTVLKYGKIITAGLNVNVLSNAFAWKLNHTEFLTPDAYSTSLDPATDGYYRTDALLGNTSGGYQILKGTQGSSSASEPTNLPAGTIKLGLINVFGATITSSNIDVSGFITKASKGFIHLEYAGLVDKLTIDDKSWLKLEGTISGLKSINVPDPANLYHGRDLILFNATAGNITLYHNIGTGNFKFWFAEDKNIIIKPGESVHIVMRAINYENNGGLLHYVGLADVELINDLTTGGTTKGLSAEMGKTLDTSKQANLTDANFGAFQNVLPTVNTLVDTDKMPFLIGSLSRMMTWLNFKAVLVATFFLDATSSIQTQLNGKQAKDSQIEIPTSTNVSNTWHGQTVLFTASCTITIPSTLNNALDFSFRTLTGVTVTWAITSPFTWETTPSATPRKTVGHFMRRGSTNTIFLDA